jgi:site-specific recombinase XerD
MICVAAQDIRDNTDPWLRMRLRMNHRPSGVDSNERDIRIFVRFLDKNNICSVSGTTLLDYITHLKDERKNCSGSINRKLSSLRSFFRHLRFVQVEGSETFPIRELPRARQPYSGPQLALEPAEVQRLFADMEIDTTLGYRNMLIYSLMYRMGLRISEVSGLNIADVNLDENLITIHGKGAKTRVLPLVDALAAQMKKWLRKRKKLLNADTLEALFISKKGKRIANRTIQENFKKCITPMGKLSLDKVTPHSLRHAFASHAIEGECNLVVLQHIMGHSCISSTQIYLHPSMGMLRKAMNDHLASEIVGTLIDDSLGSASIRKNGRKREKAA